MANKFPFSDLLMDSSVFKAIEDANEAVARFSEIFHVNLVEPVQWPDVGEPMRRLAESVTKSFDLSATLNVEQIDLSNPFPTDMLERLVNQSGMVDLLATVQSTLVDSLVKQATELANLTTQSMVDWPDKAITAPAWPYPDLKVHLAALIPPRQQSRAERHLAMMAAAVEQQKAILSRQLGPEEELVQQWVVNNYPLDDATVDLGGEDLIAIRFHDGKSECVDVVHYTAVWPRVIKKPRDKGRIKGLGPHKQ